MRALLFCVLAAVSGLSHADELADANAAFAAKNYPSALLLYTRLADSGNADAQVRLGEMYWYGEGAPIDRSRGDALFAKAAAAGNKDAAVNLGLTAQRGQKLADITYWTTTYQGADLTSGKFACAAPMVPASSSTNQEIKSVSTAMQGWRDCYNSFVANIGDAMPVGRRIPSDVAIVMSEPEVQQAKAHLERVYKQVVDKARADSTMIVAQYDQWVTSTEKSVASRNADSQAARTRLEELERARSMSAGPSAGVRK
jgi:TPR repeat protein